VVATYRGSDNPRVRQLAAELLPVVGAIAKLS